MAAYALADGQPGTARSDRDDRIERLVRASEVTGWTVHVGPVWVTAEPPGPEQLAEHGWKLHLSSRASTFGALVDRVLPILIAERCAFKLARSPGVLDELNDGITSPAAVGKAITVYPDQDRVRELGLALAAASAGHQGPRVLSDRRVSESAPVYYRYGPFVANPAANARGELATWLHGPGGQRFEAAATLSYAQPTWVTDPFTGEGAEPARRQDSRPVVGGRYQITGGIRESARGNVYRAIDLRDHAPVIVKQARALVSEDADDVDTRLRVRNERRIYQVLAGLPGVPRFVDHFRHGLDEFLVTSDCGPATLTEDVLLDGPYRPDLGEGVRGLDRLAAQLARIVVAVHERGVIVRDLAPGNIVLDDGQASLVDFGLAGYDGLHLGGGTPGYAPARQMRDDTPERADDLYALGMTLLFAATRLHPVALGDDPQVATGRAVATIRAGFGAEPGGVIAAIVDLLAGGERAAAAVHGLASGKLRPGRATRAALPRPVIVTADLADQIRASVLDQLLGQVDQMLAASADSPAAYDGCLYTGSAGIGLELLHHASEPGVAERLGDLAALTAAAVRRVQLPPGLYTGRTGADLFLRQAVLGCFLPEDGCAGPAVPPPDFTPEGDDLIVGAAGIGLGHLLAFRASGDQRHLDVARRCVARLMRSPTAESGFGRNPQPDKAVEPSAGSAHGLAGVTGTLLSFAQETGDRAVLEAAAVRTRLLAGYARDLIGQARDPAASPLAASWCQGLTGIGQTLVLAGAVVAEPGLGSLAAQAADACLALVPRMSALGQCCGAAGVGSYLIDLAVALAEPRYLGAAFEVAAHMLRRGGGPPERPVFTDSAPDSFSASWGAGLAGMLTFFRRLTSGGGPDILPEYRLSQPLLKTAAMA